MVERVKKKMQSYRKIRAKLIAKGSSLAGFAREHNYRYRTVVSAARGERRGAKSLEILAKIQEALNG